MTKETCVFQKDILETGISIVDLPAILRYRKFSASTWRHNNRLTTNCITSCISSFCIISKDFFNQFVKMPSTPDVIRENQQMFKDIGRCAGGIGLPGIDGTIVCTHVRLVNTTLQNIEEVYKNRKGYMSLNVQAVGLRTEFLDVVPEWPGSQHDSRIFQNSRIYMKYVQHELPVIIYFTKGRQIVERTFGIWKRRFPCLSKGLSNQLICSTTIVMACAVLHNLSLIFNYMLPEDVLEQDDEMEIPVEGPHWQPGKGLVMREALIERLFT